MNPPSPSDPEAPPKHPGASSEESPAELEDRIRRMREERVRKSLAALDRDRFVLGRAAGAQTLVRLGGVLLALVALWWVLARVG
jgi:hypothetical protein